MTKLDTGLHPELDARTSSYLSAVMKIFDDDLRELAGSDEPQSPAERPEGD